ncbi:MAG: hypothetical protein JWO72_1036 [Caulobacteraceae bacterium]|nr:hypothetical protein [Caulobacteraceae bacterium]
MSRVLAAVCAALSLSACATPYVGKPYDHASNGVHSIGLASDAVPKKPIAYEAASVGSNFGLIGALVDAGIQANRADEVNKALVGDGFNAESKLQGRIITALGSQGYTVKPLDTGDRAKREFVTAYPSTPEPVDAYLDVVVIDYGYLSAGAFKPFRPTLTAKVRLVSAKDTSKTLMENTIAYNDIAPTRGVITLTPNPTYAFKNRTDMLSDPKRLEAGLEDALYQVADTVAQLLR